MDDLAHAGPRQSPADPQYMTAKKSAGAPEGFTSLKFPPLRLILAETFSEAQFRPVMDQFPIVRMRTARTQGAGRLTSHADIVDYAERFLEMFHRAQVGFGALTRPQPREELTGIAQFLAALA